MFFKCNHKWLPVDFMGYQHCSKCGIAEAVGKPCNHKWEVYESANVTIFGTPSGKVYVLKCSNCGELKNHMISNQDF